MGVELMSLILDYDGTLADSIEHGMEICISVVKRNNFPVRPDIKEYLISSGHWSKSGPRMLRDGFGIPEKESVRLYKEMEEVDHKKPPPLIRGALNTVKRLYHRQYRPGQQYYLTMLSNRCRENLLFNLEYHGLDCLFRKVSAADDTLYPKPDPRAFDQILDFLKEEIGAQRINCLFAGDTPDDIKCANEAGIEVIGVTTGAHSREKLLDLCDIKPDHILSSIAELPDWMDKYQL